LSVNAQPTQEPTSTGEKTIQILLVEDEEAHAELIRWEFESAPVSVDLIAVQTLQQANDTLAELTPDLVITDLLLPDGKGTDLLPRARVGAGFPCVIMTSHGDEQAAVGAMKAGAFDYVVKSGVTLADMPHIAQRVLREWRHLAERKKAEEALRKSEERYRHLFENIRDAAFLADTETGEIVDANLQAETLLGKARDQIIGMHQTQLHPPEKPGEYKEIFRRHVEGEGGRDTGGEIVRADGTTVPVSITAAAMIIHGRNLILGLFRDITERKQAEDELHETIRLNRAFLDALPCVAMLLRPDREVVLSNRAAENVRAVPGRRCYATFGKRSDPCPWCLAPAALATGEEQHIEIEAIGSVWDAHWVPVGPDLCLHYAFDITDQRRAEEKLLDHQEQLRSLASELSLAEERERRHVATALHDRIGQALAVSKMKLAAMRQELSGSDHSEPMNEIIDLIEQTIQDTRSLTLELSPPVLYELGLEAALQWLAEEFHSRHAIACEFKDDGADKPLDDDIRIVLFQTARELLANVAKHARAGSVTIAVARAGNHIILSVQDNGIGFDTDDTASLPRKTGGFGLFNIRERIEHLGGCLDLHSQPGKGSCIKLTAPLTDES